VIKECNNPKQIIEEEAEKENIIADSSYQNKNIEYMDNE